MYWFYISSTTNYPTKRLRKYRKYWNTVSKSIRTNGCVKNGKTWPGLEKWSGAPPWVRGSRQQTLRHPAFIKHLGRETWYKCGCLQSAVKFSQTTWFFFCRCDSHYISKILHRRRIIFDKKLCQMRECIFCLRSKSAFTRQQSLFLCCDISSRMEKEKNKEQVIFAHKANVWNHGKNINLVWHKMEKENKVNRKICEGVCFLLQQFKRWKFLRCKRFVLLPSTQESTLWWEVLCGKWHCRTELEVDTRASKLVSTPLVKLSLYKTLPHQTQR